MKVRLNIFGLCLAAMLVATGWAQGVDGETGGRAVAFPGAEGYGRYAVGGRGGRVLHVTRLDDDGGEGTLRWACEQTGARTVVFDVSGTIYLRSKLRLTGDSVTIAGQTAPGDGICVADYPFTIDADEVVIRFVRFRLGNRHVDRHEGDGLGGSYHRNIIVDHCSVSWSIDECLSVYGNWASTVQWCIVSHSLNRAGHSKGAHGYGGNWGGSDASYHHNLMAHHVSRTPRLGPCPSTQQDERMDMRCNVIYNWGGNGCYGGEGMKVNIVNNYYKPGPRTFASADDVQRRIASMGCRTTQYTHHDTERPNRWDVMWHVWGKLYVAGNVNSVHDDVTADNWTLGVLRQTRDGDFDGTYDAATRDSLRLDAPIGIEPTTTHDALTAYSRVLDYAGASLRRDSYDASVVDDVRRGTASAGDCGIIDSQDEVGGWPALRSEAAPADSDGDGMPDAWERTCGLDPADPSDGAALTADGYTNLEHYMNSLVAHIVEAQNAGGIANMQP